VRERLHERGCGAFGDVGRELARCRRAAEDVPVRQLVLHVRLGADDVEQRRLVGVLRRRGLDEERRRVVFADDVGIVVHRVDRRLVRSDRDHGRRTSERLCRQRTAGAAVGTLDGVPRAPDECARGRAGQKQRADHQREDADDQRPGRADEQAEELLEPTAEGAPVRRAESGQQSERGDDQPGPKRAHVDERAPRHHQRADDDERDGSDVGGRADRADEAVRDRAADHPPAPAEVEDRGEEEAERQQPEADELVVLLAADPPAPARALLHARGHARP
jgi:hypothetical protein